MRKAITAFVRYPFYAQALVFLTLVFGIAALFSIRKASFPITESRLLNNTTLIIRVVFLLLYQMWYCLSGFSVSDASLKKGWLLSISAFS